MLPFLALLMVVSTFAGVLVVDLGTLYEMRARVHAVADLAALAAAQELPDKNAAIGAALEWARFNGFDDDADDVDVTVEIHDVLCTQPDYCVRVTIQRDFNWTFGGLFSLADTAVPSTVVAEKRSKQRDIVFIFDKSGSLSELLPDLRRAAVAFSNSPILRPGGGGDRMGLVSFASAACLELPLQPVFGAAGDDFKDAVSRIQRGERSNILPTLDEAIAEINLRGRPGSDRLIILLSDGEFTDVSSPTATAFRTRITSAQNAGIVIHAMGVSDDNSVDRDGLMLEMTIATGGTYLENPRGPGASDEDPSAGPCPGTGSGAIGDGGLPGTPRAQWNAALDAQFDAIARSLSVIALAE